MKKQPPPIDITQKPWPDGRAVRGKYYGVNDPIYHGDMLCVMLMDTWGDFGTLHEQQRRAISNLDAKIKELTVLNAVLGQRLADATERLENLRGARRKEMRAELEDQIPKPIESKPTYF